jgi:Right handed beta helix region
VFAPSDGWNHHLTFVRDDITCGSHNCFQVSGGRDLIIDGNRINGTTTAGVLTAGATRVSITRNRFVGMPGMSPCAAQIASPGMEWDNYAGVENMISSAVVFANNVVSGWGSAVQLDAARDVAIVYNTVADGKGVVFDHRVPHDQKGNVVLDGNSNIRIWNDVMPSISSGDQPPALLSNSVIWKSGAPGGTAIVTTAPTFDAASMDFALAAGSVGLDGALVNAETPTVDFMNRVRGAKPDMGASELGAPDAPVCP